MDRSGPDGRADSTERIRIGPQGRGAIYEFQGMATRVLGHPARPDEALELAARFVRSVDPRERARVENELRRGAGPAPRLTVPRPPS